MGTRGFVGFVVNGTEKIAYNHWDSYPGGVGRDVLSWLRSAALDLEVLHGQAAALRVVTDEEEPTDQDIERLKPFTNTGVGERRERPNWYQLLRETQGDPAAMLRAGAIEDAGSFPLDSLFAEWGYLVDLDARTFEVYRGFQRTPHRRGRFANREPFQPPHRRDRPIEYWPVALAASWPLDALPDEASFLAIDRDED
jgi:hypothetical protein